MTTYDLRFDYTRPPISLNDRMHHLQKARLTKAIRARTVELGADIPPLTQCLVELTWYVNDRRTRDDENPVPTLKAMCDGLVDLGIVPDDTRTYMVKRMPTIVVIPKTQDVAHMVLTVSALHPEGVAA